MCETQNPKEKAPKARPNELTRAKRSHAIKQNWANKVTEGEQNADAMMAAAFEHLRGLVSVQGIRTAEALLGTLTLALNEAGTNAVMESLQELAAQRISGGCGVVSQNLRGEF